MIQLDKNTISGAKRKRKNSIPDVLGLPLSLRKVSACPFGKGPAGCMLHPQRLCRLGKKIRGHAGMSRFFSDTLAFNMPSLLPEREVRNTRTEQKLQIIIKHYKVFS